MKSSVVSLAQSKLSTNVSASSIWKLTNSINQNQPHPHFPSLPVRRIINLVLERSSINHLAQPPVSRALTVFGSVWSPVFCWLSLPYCKQKNSHQCSQKKKGGGNNAVSGFHKRANISWAGGWEMYLYLESVSSALS